MSSPKPKRPKHKAHHSSFIDRIHRRHDERHHPGEDRHPSPVTEDAPLLREEHPDSPDAESQHIERRPSAWQQVKNAVPDISGLATSFTQTALSKAKDSAQSVGNGLASVAGSTKQSMSKVGRSVKNNPKRSLTALCGILAATTIGETVDIIRHHPLPAAHDICTTPACVQAASGILGNLHPNVLGNIHSLSPIDPCTNFDEYVCGGFRLHNDLKQSNEEISTGSLMTDEVQNMLRKILEQDRKGIAEADKEIFNKVQDAYNACLDIETIRDYDLKPLKQLTDEIKVFFLGERAPIRKTSTFQTISSPNMKAKNALTSAHLHMMKIGVSALVSFSVDADSMHPASHAIFASPVRLIGLPTNALYDNNTIIAEYETIIAGTLAHFYQVPDNSSSLLRPLKGAHSSMKELASGIVHLEAELARIMPQDPKLADDVATHKRVSFRDFQALISQLSIEAVAQELTPRKHNDTTVMVTTPAYFENLSSMIAETPTEIVQAFFIWKIIQEFAPHTESNTLLKWKEFSNKIMGKNIDGQLDRWRICLKSVEGDLGWVVSKFFVDKHFSPEGGKRGGEIIQSVKKSFGRLLMTANWMTNEDRQRTSHKIETISQNVGFPTTNPDLRNSLSVKAFYDMIVVHNNTYLENKVSANHGRLLRSWSRLGQPSSQDEWQATSTTVDAYYNSKTNEVTFPAALLAPPLLYDDSVPSYLSYGSFGAISGHEISHAVNSQGSLYNTNGTNTYLWSNSTKNAFERKSACFVDQYFRFTTDELHVDGNLTLAENIADAGGVHAAYRAWTKLEAEQSSLMLPGLDMFNQRQLFWLSYGNRWCSKSTAETQKQRTLTDSHAPKHVRLLGSVANSHEFKRDFGCSSREPDCEMW